MSDTLQFVDVRRVGRMLNSTGAVTTDRQTESVSDISFHNFEINPLRRGALLLFGESIFNDDL